MKTITVLLLILLTGGSFLYAQKKGEESDRTLLGSNAEGSHFMVGFMQNEMIDLGCGYAYGQRLISIASRFDNNVTVTLPNGQTWGRALKAFEVYDFEVERLYECIGEGVFHKGVEIVSDRPISVYCYNGQYTTSDGYLALPITTWGMQYVAASYSLDYYSRNPRDPFNDICRTYPRGGELAAIAIEDQTTVTVYPNTATLLGVQKGRPYTKILNKGDIFQVQDGGSLRGQTDLTGSQIVSDKPIGLLSGHVRTGIPVVYDTKDHIIEMIPPRNTLGKRHICVPYGGRQGGDLVRVIGATASPVNVNFTGVTGTTTNYVISTLGEWIDFDLQQLTVITSDQPVLVVHYSKSTDADPRNVGKSPPPVKFDPYMVVITPEEQFVNAAVFQTLPNWSSSPSYPGAAQQYNHHYVTIVGERTNFSSIKLNGQDLASQLGYTSGLVPNTPYAWASMEVADGEIHVLKGDVLFGGYVYGLGNFDSYGWPVGAGLRKLGVDDPNPPVLAALRICGGYEVTARESGPFESGLKDAWLDTTWSQNVTFSRVFIIRGDEYSLGVVRAIDPTKPARARIIAEDIAGNRDTIELSLDVKSLTFDRDSILVRRAVVNVLYKNVIRITNPNSDTLRLDSLYCIDRKGFFPEENYMGVVIPPGGSVDVIVNFGSSIKAVHRDTLVICADCQTYRIPLMAMMSLPGIATEDLEFGSLRKGKSRCLDLHVRSTGDDTLRLDSAQLSGDNFTITVRFSQTLLLPPGTDTTLEVCFHPDSVGEFFGNVRFYSNADSIAVAKLHGRGIYPVISIGGYDFGTIQVGDTLCAMIPVTNTGEDTAHVTGLLLSDSTTFVYDHSRFPANLAKGDTLWVNICFTPRAEQGYLGDLFPRNSDGLEDVDSLRGAGFTLQAVINGYDWHERRVGSQNDTVVFVRNLSNNPITISRVWISDGDIGDFAAEDLPGPVVLPAGDSVAVAVQFNPMLAGYRSCYIRAATSSRQTPEIFAILQGFALIPMASDELIFDSSPIYSCGTRSGRIVLSNDGNMPLTLSTVGLDANPLLMKLSGVNVGDVILSGDSLVLNFLIDYAGYLGGFDGKITWSFEELPDTFEHEIRIPASFPQSYGIELSTPAVVSVGGEFDLLVRVDSIHWSGVPEQGVTLRIMHNPTIVRFNPVAWQNRTATDTSVWRPVGNPMFVAPGVVELRFEPTHAASLDSVTFLAIPFRGYLGDARLDTFHVTMQPTDVVCALPTEASIPYSMDGLCGFSGRLFEVTGDPYSLKQNSPNPANGRTEIVFDLGMDAPTTLEIIGLDGIRVATLIDEHLPAGHYAVPVEVGEIPAGVYYYRLTSGPFSGVRRMVIVR